MEHPFVTAIKFFGSQVGLARAIGVPQAYVHFWLRKAKKGVSPQHCGAIERATGGLVTRADLRPDIFGPDAL